MTAKGPGFLFSECQRKHRAWAVIDEDKVLENVSAEERDHRLSSTHHDLASEICSEELIEVDAREVQTRKREACWKRGLLLRAAGRAYLHDPDRLDTQSLNDCRVHSAEARSAVDECDSRDRGWDRLSCLLELAREC